MTIFSTACRQRGLSLVEVMIVVVVVGILLGAIIVPLQALLNDNAYSSEERRMAQLHEAVVGYAVRHQTKQRVAQVATGGMRIFKLPAGRPYLPCPDIDGDGHEDRHANSLAMNTVVAATTTLNIGDLTVAPNDNLLTSGSCLVSRGVLPWKTLGVPPADNWGNRYTYQVDDAFSNAIVGFNENTKADVFDSRITVLLTSPGDFLYPSRVNINTSAEKEYYRVITDITVDINTGLTITTSNTLAASVTLSYLNTRRPIVVCEGTVAVCQQSVPVGLVLAAGEIQKSAYSAPNREYTAGDISDGLPFVIVSHGKNGRGAVNHNTNESVNTVSFSVLICNEPIYNTVAAVGMAIPDHSRHEAVNFPQVEAPNQNGNFCPQLIDGTGGFFRNGYFVAAPRSEELFAGGSNDSFDDIVTWMTRDELVRALTGGLILPAADMPILKDY